MWKLILSPCLRRRRAPQIDTSLNDITFSNQETRLTDPKLFPEGTCTSCQKLTLHELLKTQGLSVEKCWLEYNRADLSTNCPMCRLIFKTLWASSEYEQDEKVRLELIVERSWPRGQVWEVRAERYRVAFEDYTEIPYYTLAEPCFRVYADPGSYASSFILGRRPPSSNLSHTTFQKIAGWIKDCDQNHKACHNHLAQFSEATPRHFPTRVINVGSATRQPRLHVSQSQQSDRYIALSHCWGNIAQVKTLNANIGDFQEEIVFDSLSKTFQDAISVTRRLGIEFLWIDSLCIVQDDKDDWFRESERMGSIYANAYVTIAATWATDGSGGLDSTRSSTRWIEFPYDGSDEAKGYMWFSDASCTSMTDIDEAPLNKRGWVFQEKTLSRRIIHFASSQVYWECKQRFYGQESEEEEVRHWGVTNAMASLWATVNAVPHIGLLPVERVDIVRDPVRSTQLDIFCSSWQEAICYYCTREFTHKTDRLIALLGIIRIVEDRTGLRCIDGHWDDGSSRLIEGLMWLPEVQRKLPVLHDNKPSRLCSSWSWASLEGPILKIDKAYVCTGRNGFCLKAIEDKVHVPWPSHPLKISGRLPILYKGEQGAESFQDQYSEGRRTFLLNTELAQSIGGWVCFDREEEEPERFYFSPMDLDGIRIPLYFWPIQLGVLRIPCIALLERQVAEIKGRCFERVGAGFVDLVVPPDGSEPCEINVFKACEETIFYII